MTEILHKDRLLKVVRREMDRQRQDLDRFDAEHLLRAIFNELDRIGAIEPDIEKARPTAKTVAVGDIVQILPQEPGATVRLLGSWSEVLVEVVRVDTFGVIGRLVTPAGETHYHFEWGRFRLTGGRVKA